jgi:enamine deaminase RidA (YjgF/YER057c/UK114 family)
MERKPINPWSWSIKLGFDQAQLVDGHQRLLVCSGQDAVDADGNPQHPGDMAAQLEMSLDNLEAVLAAADMTLANVVRLNVYTTDFDELVKHWARLTDASGAPMVALRPPC